MISVLHQLVLTGAHLPAKIEDVVSDGEYRAVAIAAFLADHTATSGTGPIIFDDPLSSLDDHYEEAVVSRLVELAKERQIVVFTHRLATAAMLAEASDLGGVARATRAVEREVWGSGETRIPPLQAQVSGEAVKQLRRDVKIAKEARETKGQVEYEVRAQSICSNARKLIEGLVADDLIGGITARFRRKITTQNKLHWLTAITEADCTFIDSMMTHFSYYEHLQPQEAPVALPLPDDLDARLLEIEKWIADFRSRARAAAKREAKAPQTAPTPPDCEQCQSLTPLDAHPTAFQPRRSSQIPLTETAEPTDGDTRIRPS